MGARLPPAVAVKTERGSVQTQNARTSKERAPEQSHIVAHGLPDHGHVEAWRTPGFTGCVGTYGNLKNPGLEEVGGKL